MLKKEWQKLIHNPILMIVIAAVVIIPTIYTTLFLGSMWDPYGKVENLPVAVVNLDREVDYEGETLNVGQALVDNLKDNDSLDFQFVDKAQAADGLADGSYYMVITIPENFSEHAATLMDDEPVKMQLDYEVNPGTNYIASKMSESALEKIKNSVAQEVTRTYAEAVFDQIAEAGDGMQEAADGSGKLKDGAGKLADGNAKITENLQKLADSTLTFRDGSESLEVGMTEYVNGVSAVADGAVSLSDGVKKLADGTGTLENGAAALKTGTEQVSGGLEELQSKVPALTDGAAKLEDGSARLAGGLADVSSNMDTFNGKLKNAAGLAATLDEKTAALKTQVDELAAAYEAQTASTQNTVSSLENQLGETQQKSAEAAEALERVSGQVNTSELQSQIAELQSQVQGLREADLSTVEEQLDSMEAACESLSAQLDTLENTQDMEAVNTAKTALAEIPATENGGETAATEQEDTMKKSLQEMQAAVGALSQYMSALDKGLNGDAASTNPLEQAGLVGSAAALKSGTDSLVDGANELSAGTKALNSQVPALATGVDQLAAGAKDLNNGAESLLGGSRELNSGAQTLAAGTDTLTDGTQKLTANNETLLNGAQKLRDGAGQISDGAGQLYDGSKELGDGITQVSEGAGELQTALSDGAAQVKENTVTDANLDMFSTPVEVKESKLTEVPNNGHAMAPYMMSVALWVGCIAFCIMYPLTQYYGALKSGTAWWLAKASVLYGIAVLQALVMIGCLHLFNGFTPADMKHTLIVACVASVSFMSIMYFFNVTMGKVGSFLMLIFMVVQLAGSAGTYPIELSGAFVPKIHDYLPFSYTVMAFRRTIAGSGSIAQAVIVLAVVAVVFTALTILEFQIRAKKIKAGKKVAIDWLEAKGLA